MTRIAVVGTGRMGSAMARAMARGGADLVLHNRTPAAARELADELGAQVAGTAREAASQADIAVTMLADGPAVIETWEGPDGLAAGEASWASATSEPPPIAIEPTRLVVIRPMRARLNRRKRGRSDIRDPPYTDEPNREPNATSLRFRAPASGHIELSTVDRLNAGSVIAFRDKF